MGGDGEKAFPFQVLLSSHPGNLCVLLRYGPLPGDSHPGIAVPTFPVYQSTEGPWNSGQGELPSHFN